MEAALSIAACGRASPAQPCDGGGTAAPPASAVRRDDPSSFPPAPAAPLVLVTDRLDTPGGSGAAVIDRAWTELAAAVAAGRAQASRVAVLALERPPALYRRRRWQAEAPASGAAAAVPPSSFQLHVVDGYTDPFGWIGGGGAGGGEGEVQKTTFCGRIDDLGGLARALLIGAGDGDGDPAAAPRTTATTTPPPPLLVVVIDSLSALLARHAPLDVLRWLDAEILRSPRVSAVLALLHSDQGGEEGGGPGASRAATAAAAAAASAGSPGGDSVAAAFEALASASLQLLPLTPAQRDLSGADGELRVVCRRRGGAAAGLGQQQGSGGKGLIAAAGASAAVDSTRVFGGAGRPRAERLIYTLGRSGWREEDEEEESLAPPAAARRWLRAGVALAPMPRGVAAPDARALAARAAERTVTSMAQQQQQQQHLLKAPEQPPSGGQRHDRLAARGGRPGTSTERRRVWAPLGRQEEDGEEADGGSAAAAGAPPTALGARPGHILFERDSGGSSAESGADPDEDLEI